MGKASIMVIGGLAVLAGCGTLLDIQPGEVPPGDDGGMPVSDGSSSEGAAPVDAGGVDAADGATSTGLCSPSIPPPCVLAQGLVNLDSIAVGNRSVYFTRHESAGAILQVPSTGGAVTGLVPSALPAGLFATATDLYWVTQGDFQIVRQPFGATVPTASTYDVAVPAAQIAAFGSDTFWTIPGNGSSDGQLRVSSPGFNVGAPLLVNLPKPTALAVDANYVYYAEKTSSGHVVRMTHTGASPTKASIVFSQVSALALSGPTKNLVAITTNDGVYRAGTQSDAAFMGPWVQVSTNKTGVGVVADDTTGTLYVLAADGTLEVIPNVDSPPITSIKIASCTGGTAIAQGGADVYLACKDTIVRVSK